MKNTTGTNINCLKISIAILLRDIKYFIDFFFVRRSAQVVRRFRSFTKTLKNTSKQKSPILNYLPDF